MNEKMKDLARQLQDECRKEGGGLTLHDAKKRKS